MGLGVRKPLCFPQRQTVLAEMHATSALGERDIQPIVHQDACWSTIASWRYCGPLQSFTREEAAGSTRKIFLPNLYPIDASDCRGSDLQQESFLCLPRFGCGEAVPVRHVAEEQAAR